MSTNEELEKEVNELRRRVALLEEIAELKKKLAELEKQVSVPILQPLNVPINPAPNCPPHFEWPPLPQQKPWWSNPPFVVTCNGGVRF
jgi:hypothetical protein